MTMKLPAPRLLPMTIAMMATVLAMKCVELAQAVLLPSHTGSALMMGEAIAASTDQTRPAGKAAGKADIKAVKGKSAGKDGPGKGMEAGVMPAPKASGAPAAAISPGEMALLQDLRKRREQLDAQAAALRSREALVAAAEQKIAARVAELQTLQKKLQGLDAARKAKEDAGWQGLVKLYEVMKPQDAATIFDDLSMPVLLQILDRMKDIKAAAVMAAMKPDKAREVTAALARMRTGRDAGDASVDGRAPVGAGGYGAGGRRNGAGI